MKKYKLNINVLIAVAVALFYTVIVMVLLSSCSANYHFRKFLLKGGKIDTTEIVTTLHDTLRINGKDSVIERVITTKCPEPKVPETRYETRWKYKVKLDSFQTIRYITKWKTKEIVKTKRAESRPNWWLLVVCLIVGFVGALITVRK